jgi:hypothetical protein
MSTRHSRNGDRITREPIGLHREPGIQRDLFRKCIPPCGRSSMPFCEVEVVRSSSGVRFDRPRCGCTAPALRGLS